MSLSYLKIGRRIRELRMAEKLSQMELAELADISPTYMSYIETGVRKLSIDTLVQIANALQVTTDSILEFALEVKKPVLLAEYARVLERCSVQERRVLIEMTDMMIDIMRKNQASLNPKR